MIRLIVPLTLTALFAARVPGAAPNQLDSNETLFTILAAINAAGYDVDAASPNNSPLRKAIRDRLVAQNPPILPELKTAYRAHPGLNPYLSLAVSITGPPDFNFKGRTVDVPPDALPLEPFRNLLPRFYSEAHINELWKASQPALDQAIARYHEPVSHAVLQVNSYLRSPNAGYLGRHFQIYIDLLAAPNQVQTRNYGDEYYIIVTPSAEPRVTDIRHAYLHFLLDPVAIKYGMDLLKKRALGDYAQTAPALEDRYKSDFVLLATECLIKAVEGRLDRNPSLATQALREGYILTPFFFEEMPAYEKQPQSMRFYFPEMVKALDSQREAQRLSHVDFVAATQVHTAKPSTDPARPVLEQTQAAKTLDKAEDFYWNKDLDKAKQLYLQSLQERGDTVDRAKSYYGLGRIAILQKDGEVGEKLLLKALDAGPDPQVKAWVLVYLGRLADIGGDREAAAKRYQEALAVDGASAAARKAAEKGTQETFKK